MMNLLKRFKRVDKKVFLIAENKNIKPKELKEDAENILWDVVTYVIRAL